MSHRSKQFVVGKRKRRPRDEDTDSDSDADDPGVGGVVQAGLLDALMPRQGVRTEDNHVYLYGDVTQRSMESLVKAIRELGCELRSVANRFDVEPRIFLHINSDGGEVYPAFAAVDTILHSPVPVTTIVEGCVASAATMISMAGAERRMLPHSHVLLHEVRSAFWGKMAQIDEEMTNLEKLMDMIAKYYRDRSKMGLAEIRRVLRKDEMWDAQTCLRKGVVDFVCAPPPPARRR
jgi:ATP-dependent Clp protease protease subunit